MRSVRILSVRKNTDSRVAALEREYLERLRPHVKMEIEDIRQTYAEKNPPTAKILEKEAELIDKKIKTGERVVSLAVTGKSFSSEGFAHWLDGRWNLASRITFVIGGAYGLHEQILKRSDLILSLSSLTLTHELARLALIEAVYRSADILKGGQYHK